MAHAVLVVETQKKTPKDGHRLLQDGVLIDGGRFIQRLAATGFRLPTVVKDVPGADTALRAYLAAGDTALGQSPRKGGMGGRLSRG